MPILITGQLTAQIKATKTSSARRKRLDITASTSEVFTSRAQVDLVRPRTARLAMQGVIGLRNRAWAHRRHGVRHSRIVDHAVDDEVGDMNGARPLREIAATLIPASAKWRTRASPSPGPTPITTATCLPVTAPTRIKLQSTDGADRALAVAHLDQAVGCS